MDFAAVIGTFLGFAFILTGMVLEGGNIGQILQITAAFIVIGGTSGAVFLSFPIADFKTAFSLLKTVYFNQVPDYNKLIAEIVDYSQKARKIAKSAKRRLSCSF